MHVVAIFLHASFCPAAIFCHCSVLLGKQMQMSMETADTPSTGADNPGGPGPRGSPLLDADLLQPRAPKYLADWEITELILRLEAEQRLREQARWEEAEGVRRANPRPCFHLCACCQRLCVHKSRSIGEHQQQMRDHRHRCDAHWYYSPQPGV